MVLYCVNYNCVEGQLQCQRANRGSDIYYPESWDLDITIPNQDLNFLSCPHLGQSYTTIHAKVKSTL